MDEVLRGLKAVADPTRLRVLALCGHAELTVSDLVEILGQSQPRISRHLKLLVEAGLLQRNQEGPFAWYRTTKSDSLDIHGVRHDRMGHMAEALLDLLPGDDRMLNRDLEQLQGLLDRRLQRAVRFFKKNAANWDNLRRLYLDEDRVNAELLDFVQRAGKPVDFLDIGTGTGRVVELLAPHVRAATGVDISREMLTLARSVLEQSNLANCQVRLADMHDLPFADGSFDAACLNMVLHYAREPIAALREASRVLRPGGRLIIVDFATHEERALIEEHAHVWPGFETAGMAGWCKDAALDLGAPLLLEGGPVKVCLWEAERAQAAGSGAQRQAALH